MEIVRFPCPSCGFLVFTEGLGSYEICSMCGWEDDPVQSDNPGLRGGANGGSLKEYQDSALEEYPNHIREAEGFIRAADWRPLTPTECEVDNTGIGTGVKYFHESIKTPCRYYWRSDA